MKTKLLTICLLLFSSQVFAKHYILGTEPPVYLEGKYEILADIKVNNLHIRHVRAYPGSRNFLCSGNDKNYEFIEVHGEINSDTHIIIRKLLKKINNNPNVCNNIDNRLTYVYLSSGGGFMRDGILLGELLRKERAGTIIANNAICYSSCAAAFLGGYLRVVYHHSTVMFHAPYTYNSSKDISCIKRSNKLLSYMQGMIGNDNGRLLYEKTLSYCSESAGWFLNRDAAILFGIDNFPYENIR